MALTPYQFRVYILFLSPPLGEAGKGFFAGAFMRAEISADVTGKFFPRHPERQVVLG